MAKQHDKQFKLDAIQYYQDHKDLGVRGCAENLGMAAKFSSRYFAFSGSFIHFCKNALETDTVVGTPCIEVVPVFI